MTHNNWDKYLDPPDDETEAERCEFCGQELVECDPMEFYCKNQFCPDKFDKKDGLLVHEMSEHLVEVEQELADLKVKYQQLKNITLFQRS